MVKYFTSPAIQYDYVQLVCWYAKVSTTDSEIEYV